MASDVQIKRIYDAAAADDGYRVLIDRLWPRGISKERAQLDAWARLAACARRGRVTILYAARDREHNDAVVVAEVVRDG